jgi:hypothetical protein
MNSFPSNGGAISPMKPNLRLTSPDTEKLTVAVGRKPNEAYRTREYLTETEVAAGGG